MQKAAKGGVRLKQSRKIRVIIIVLSVLLAASLFALGETLTKGRAAGNLKDTAVSEDNFITPGEAAGEAKITETESKIETDGRTETLCGKFGTIASYLTRPIRSYIASCYAYAADNEITLSGANASENVRFDLGNMFPGDKETKTFRVKVKHRGTVKVHCEAVVNTADTAAAKAMKVQVKIGRDGTEIYDGEMLDMPDKAVYTLSGSGTTELEYKITAYIETSVGNEFQNKMIRADFKWWLEEVSDGHGGGGTDTDKDKDKTDDEPDDGKDNQKDEEDSSDDKKDDSKDTGKNQGAPKTGDSQDLFLWIGLAALTGGGTIFLIAKKRQKDGEEND